ncbi:MAG: hypothetical protein GY938_06265 [Ketobacter sp.]|nr:hypothetical protein [Ketobacter sp.]
MLTQMQGVADGEVETDTAKGVCNIAQQVYNTMNIELKVATARAKYGEDLQVVALGFDD